MTTINEYVYSTNYHAVKCREYRADPVKYAIIKKQIAENLHNRYHSEDDEIRNEFRRQRQVNNKKTYQNRKLRLAEEARIKANIAS